MNLSQLFQASKDLNYDHSNGMIPVEEMRGPGFFPGCTGTIDSRQDITGLRVMVLGQDFDTEANHKRIDKSKGEIENNTAFRNLKKLLGELDIDETGCFFTNPTWVCDLIVIRIQKPKIPVQVLQLKEEQKFLPKTVRSFS